MPYRWEPTAGASGRYRDTGTGRFVAGKTVRLELDRYLEKDDPAKALATSLRNREISLADWELAFRRHIKNTHINAVALERGGYANMRPSDWGRVGQIVREQYGYLKRFAGQIASGEQKMDGRLVVRAQLYSQAGRESFYRSKHANLQPGIDMVRSIRHSRDSCVECVSLDGKWFKVGDPEYKIPGRRICNKNCRCSEDFGRMTADGVELVEGSPGGESYSVIAPPSFTLPSFVEEGGVRYYQEGRLPEGVLDTQWLEKLTADERHALSRWSLGEFRTIREAWSSGNEASNPYTSIIESALSKAPRVTGTVYRGISAPDRTDIFGTRPPVVVERYQRAVGTVMEWDAPASASLSSETARGWGQVLFEIEVKNQPLIRAASAHEYEDEVLLWGRTRYTVTEVVRTKVYRFETDEEIDTWLIHLIQH